MCILTDKQIRSHYAENYEKNAIDDKMIVYETRDGQSIVDSPFAMFLYLTSQSTFDTYKHIWVVVDNNPKIKEAIPKKLLGKVEFVIRNSKRYVECLLSAKYLINNSTFQSFFSKREEQVYINTWHGTPLKHMGFDIPENPAHSQNVLRNLLMTNYLISPNEHTTRIFSESYRMNGIYPGKILEGGYPRIDLTLSENPSAIIEELKDCGIVINSKLPITLYMPTWRGDNVKSPIMNLKQTIKEVNYLREQHKNQYNILLKVHPYVYEEAAKYSELRSFLIPDYIDPNRVLSCVDILVTDFSSAFFDYLVTDRPIIFYSWDADLYEDERGMYFSMEELPGPLTKTVFQLSEKISTVNNWRSLYKKNYENLKNKIVHYDDGNATERIVKYIFSTDRNKDKVNEISLLNDKKKILIYAGGMKNNGITSSLLNLLNTVDYAKYDITLFSQNPNSKTIHNYINIPETVRLIFKPGAPIYTLEEEKLNESWQKNELNDENFTLPIKGYNREARRLFSGLHFDYALDFSGYSFYWSKFIAFCQANKKGIFQHNDLWLDAHKKINGKQPHLKNLLPLFRIYKYFNHIINVSNSLKDINFKNLNDYISKEQLRVVMNGLNLERIFKQKNKVIIQKKNIARISLEFFAKRDYNLQVYSDFESISQGKSKTVSISKEDRLITVAKATLNLLVFYKLLLNDCYIGWVDENDLPKDKGVVFFSKEKLSKVASFKRHKKSPIFLSVPSDNEHRELRCWSNYIDDRYVWIREKVTTMIGEFYHIYDLFQPIGWIETTAVGNFHDISSISPLNFYFVYKNKRNPRILPEKISQAKFKITFKDNQQLKVYSEPRGLKNSFIKYDNYLVSKETSFNVTEVISIENRKWFLLTENTAFFGWVLANDIENNISLNNNTKNELEINKENISALLTKTGINYVMMGRFSPEKNHEKLIIAFQKLVIRFPDSKLFLIGEGSLKEEIEKMAYDLNIGDKVYFLGQLSNPFPVLKLFDVFVLPSLYEGQPMVLLEALTLGLKVVASDIPQNRELLKQGKLGMLVKGTSTESITSGLIDIRDDNVSYDKFDYYTYNRLCAEQVEILLNESRKGCVKKFV